MFPDIHCRKSNLPNIICKFCELKVDLGWSVLSVYICSSVCMFTAIIETSDLAENCFLPFSSVETLCGYPMEISIRQGFWNDFDCNGHVLWYENIAIYYSKTLFIPFIYQCHEIEVCIIGYCWLHFITQLVDPLFFCHKRSDFVLWSVQFSD